MTNKSIIIQGRISGPTAEWYTQRQKLWNLTSSELLRKLLEDYQLLEREPYKFLFQRLSKPHQHIDGYNTLIPAPSNLATTQKTPIVPVEAKT